jgi:hypothetical protein
MPECRHDESSHVFLKTWSSTRSDSPIEDVVSQPCLNTSVPVLI